MRTIFWRGLAGCVGLLSLMACQGGRAPAAEAKGNAVEKAEVGSVCQVTSINGRAPRDRQPVTAGSEVLVYGWATVADAEHPVADHVQLLAVADGKAPLPPIAMGQMPMEELAAGNPKLEMAGFEGHVTFPEAGNYSIRLALEGRDWRAHCDPGSLVLVVD